MPFIVTDSGFVNLDFVATIAEEYTKGKSPLFVLKDATGRRIGTTHKDPETFIYAVIPATPGFVAVRYFPAIEAEPECVIEQPIVGWHCRPEGAFPVLVGEESEEYDVQYPDGRIEAYFDRTYETRDEWMQDRREAAAVAEASRRQREAERKAADRQPERITA